MDDDEHAQRRGRHQVAGGTVAKDGAGSEKTADLELLGTLADRCGRTFTRLGIKRVPIKLFVENGIIRKSWGGATVQQDKQDEFLSWLKQL